jgi:hypothetical protein
MPNFQDLSRYPAVSPTHYIYPPRAQDALPITDTATGSTIIKNKSQYFILAFLILKMTS